MRLRALLPALALLLTIAPVGPSHAVGLPMLTCKWKGTVHGFDDVFIVLLDIGDGVGRCVGDGNGPYQLTFTDGSGGHLEASIQYIFHVGYHLRSERDGSTRFFRQDWNGVATTDCSISPFVVRRKAVGMGNISICPSPASPSLPETFDLPATFTWRFIPVTLP